MVGKKYFDLGNLLSTQPDVCPLRRSHSDGTVLLFHYLIKVQHFSKKNIKYKRGNLFPGRVGECVIIIWCYSWDSLFYYFSRKVDKVFRLAVFAVKSFLKYFQTGLSSPLVFLSFLLYIYNNI